MGGVITLARWLGPWADQARAPTVEVSEEIVDGIRVRVFGKRRRSTYLIAPGLHYAGPDDPRMDRFCRVMAKAGHLVVAPFIPDYLALTPGAGAIEDFKRVHARWAEDRPVVFSISFGSLLALALAAERPAQVKKLVLFGGYADFHDVLRFCLTGEGRDPLNQPVVLMNLLEHVEHEVRLRGELVAGWRRYVERTWGRPEMKARERFVAIADELAPTVPTEIRELFLIGIGARDGAWPIAEQALRVFDARALDPRPYLPHVRGRVELVHGMDDDVIPWQHAHQLAAGLTAADARVHVTGLYGHTGASRPRLGALARELWTMIRVLRILAR